MNMLGAAISRTISVPELAWTIVCLVALYYGVRLTARARRALATLRKGAINGDREYAATTTILFYGTVTFVLATFVFIGLAAMTVPSPGGRVQPISWFLTATLIVGAMALAFALWMNERRRETLERRLAILLAQGEGNQGRRSGD